MNYTQQNIRNYAMRNRRQFFAGTGIYNIAVFLTSTMTTITP